MSNNKELTPAESIELIHNFGTKCYKKGYRRAFLEAIFGVVLSAILLGGPVTHRILLDMKQRTKNEEKPTTNEEAE